MSAPVSFHPPIIQQQQQLQTNNQESSISKALSKQSLSHISPSPRLLRNNKILPSHPLMCDSSPLLATKPLVAPSSSQITTIAESPRLSWLPGLFHFKKPKVISFTFGNFFIT